MASCTREPPSEDASPGAATRRLDAGTPAALTNPHRLRNAAKIHAERDTRQGYLDAAAHLRRLVELKLARATDRLNLAKVLLFAGDVDGSADELEIARRAFGEEKAPLDLNYVTGLCSLRQARYPEALAHFSRVLEKRPNHVPTLYQRGRAEEELKRPGDAEKSYRRVLSLDPQHRASTYRLATVLRALKRTDEAKETLQRFLALPKTDTPEDGKCDLTEVTLRPQDRPRPDPPEVAFSWTDMTEKIIGHNVPEGVSRALPLYRGEKASGSPVSVQWGSSVYVDGAVERRRELLLVGPSGLRILRLGDGASRAAVDVLAAGAVNDARSAVVADFDNDDLNDLLVVSSAGLHLYRGSQKSLFRSPVGLPSEDGVGEPSDAGAFDADHDGDLDIVVLARRGESFEAFLLRNNGDGTFKKLSPFGAFESASASRLTLAAHDVDQANDLDFVFAGGALGIQVFLNRRDGTFSRIVLSEFAGRTQVLVEDLNQDGAPDFFATGGDPGWTYAMNADPLGKPYTVRIEKPVVVSSPRCRDIHDCDLADIDNDGDLDVLLAAASGITVLRNVPGGDLREDDAVPVAGGARAISLSTADLTGDGLLEVLVGTGSGRPVILSSGARPAYASWKVWLKGKRDNANAIGTVVEQFCGALYQNLLVRDAGPVHLGLGRKDRSEIDGLRLRWPQGIVQAVPAFQIQPDAHGEVRFTQTESVVSSCPFLYAYGGAGWRFLTDILGIAPLDEWRPEGESSRLDPEEYVRLEGSVLASRAGSLHIAITEELRETAYLDRLELVAVDHPANREVYPDESTRQGPYEPLQLLALRRSGLRPPASVCLPDGTEARAAVSCRDRVYAHGYSEAPSQWSGWVERYALDLTLAGPARALLLTGRVAWYDSAVAYSLSQHGRTWGPLRLERLEDDGRSWAPVEDLGLPAGMDRTIVAVFATDLAPGVRLRLSANHRLLWDRIWLASDLESLDLRGETGRLELGDGQGVHYRVCEVQRATLGFHGFSTSRGSRTRHEQTYSYESASPGDLFSPALGWATRYGDVTRLLHEHDDLLVVLVTGDGVRVEFEAPPEAGPGMRRTYFLRVSGWAKEGGFHNRTGSSIDPLPLRNMSEYPPRAGELRRDAAYRAYLETYQTRLVRRRAP